MNDNLPPKLDIDKLYLTRRIDNIKDAFDKLVIVLDKNNNTFKTYNNIVDAYYQHLEETENKQKR